MLRLGAVTEKHTKDRLSSDIPPKTLNLSANFVMDLKRYSSSSMVPLRPDPTFRSDFRFDRELRLAKQNSYVNDRQLIGE